MNLRDYKYRWYFLSLISGFRRLMTGARFLVSEISTSSKIENNGAFANKIFLLRLIISQNQYFAFQEVQEVLKTWWCHTLLCAVSRRYHHTDGPSKWWAGQKNALLPLILVSFNFGTGGENQRGQNQTCSVKPRTLPHSPWRWWSEGLLKCDQCWLRSTSRLSACMPSEMFAGLSVNPEHREVGYLGESLRE